MGLRNAMLTRRIVRRPIDRTECSLAGNAALELRSHFLGASFFQGIGTTGGHQDDASRAQQREEFHPLILESWCAIAIVEWRGKNSLKVVK